MNYIQEQKAFHKWLEFNPGLSSNARILWYSLFHFNNECGWKKMFNVARSRLEADTGLSKDSIIRARIALRESGLINFEIRPGRQSTVYELVSIVGLLESHLASQLESLTATQEELESLTATQSATQSATILKHKPKHNISKHKEVCTKEDKEPSTKKKPSKKFIKPTLEELKAYIIANGYYVDADGFMDFHDSNGWKVGKNPMKDWKAAVRTWNRRNHEVKPTGRSRANGTSKAKHIDNSQFADVEVTEL